MRSSLFVIFYLALSYLSLFERGIAGEVMWLPAGLLTGALLLLPRRCWLQIIILSAVSRAIFAVTQDQSLVLNGFELTMGVLRSFLGVWLFHKLVAPRCDFERTDHVIGFWVICVIVSTACASAVESGFFTLVDGGVWPNRFLTAFTRDATGIALIAPLVITVGNRILGLQRPPLVGLTRLRRLTVSLAATACGGASAIGDLVFGQPTKYLISLSMVTAGTALGPSWTAVAGVVMAIVVIIGLELPTNSFGVTTLDFKILNARFFIGATMLAAQLASASARTLYRSRAKLRAKEKALESRDQLMQYIIGHDHSGVAVHDRDLNYIYVSQQYLDTYGITETDVLGRHHYDVFPDLPQKWRDVHQRALAGEVLGADEDPWEHEDGSVDFTRWECRPWYDADGEVGGIIVYTEIVNERKRARDQLLAYQGRLRMLASELTTSGEREQQRLAVSLHDGVGQVLAAAKMEAQLLKTETDPEKLTAHAQNLEKLVALSIAEVRELTADLAPSILVERGLDACLEWLVERYEELYDLRCKVSVIGPRSAGDQASTMVLFRIARESLNNVVRHSGTKDASITVRLTPEYTEMVVVDHGNGFDPEEVTPEVAGGFGLFTMREECAARSGEFEIQSSPGDGTRIRVRLPKTASEEDAEAC